MTDVAIRISNLTVSKNEQTICRVSDLEATAGETVGIVGPNGSGKSTLLRVLAGIEPDYTGTCTITAAVRERVFVHQSPYIFRGTVSSNVFYGLRARSMRAADRRIAASDWLTRLGIVHLSDRDVSGLSGGERRRVALARACVLRPQLLLLDEPLADLDEPGIEQVKRALAELAGTTIVVASPTPLPPQFVEREIALTAS